MNKRLCFLLGVLVAASGATAAFWFWPAASGKLPKDVFKDLRGPIHVVRIEPPRKGCEPWRPPLSPQPR